LGATPFSVANGTTLTVTSEWHQYIMLFSSSKAKRQEIRWRNWAQDGATVHTARAFNITPEEPVPTSAHFVIWRTSIARQKSRFNSG
jgi:hypothetical protein